MKTILILLLALVAITPARAQIRISLGGLGGSSWNGAFLGATAGSIYNASDRFRSPEAVAIGAGVGFLLGGLSESRAYRNEYAYRDNYYGPHYGPYAATARVYRAAPATITRQVTTTTSYSAPVPQPAPTPSGTIYPGSGAAFVSRVAYPGSGTR